MDHAEDGVPIPQRYWAILTLMVGVALSCLDTALDFTPWLADTENLSLLADTLNLGPLQLHGTEVPVGNFSSTSSHAISMTEWS